MKRISTLLKLIATGSFTLLLSACYGVYYFVDKKIKVTVTNTQGEPVQGIKVTYTEGFKGEVPLEEEFYTEYPQTTDEYGETLITASVERDTKALFVKVEDIDGGENLGDFKTQIIEVDEENERIILEPK